jgi:hypothetical protein
VATSKAEFQRRAEPLPEIAQGLGCHVEDVLRAVHCRGQIGKDRFQRFRGPARRAAAAGFRAANGGGAASSVDLGVVTIRPPRRLHTAVQAPSVQSALIYYLHELGG